MIENNRIRALIIDDEPSARQVLRIMVENYESGCTIIGEAWSVKSGIQAILDLKPDLLFLDIEFPDGTGFDILEKLNKHLVPTIFITAFDHYAINAIKHNAFDYILKPVDQIELFQAIDKIKKTAHKEIFTSSFNNYQFNKNVSSPEKQKISIQHKGELVFVSFSDIMYCIAEKSYTSIYLHNNTSLLSSKNLGEFEKILPDENQFKEFFFSRIHHSTIINTKYIEKYDSKKGIVKLSNNVELKVSERRKPLFHKRLKLISDHM